MLCRSEYAILHVVYVENNVRYIVGDCVAELSSPQHAVTLKVHVRDYVETQSLHEVKQLLQRRTQVRTCLLLSSKLIRHLSSYLQVSIVNIPIDIVRYPYVSSSSIEICRKVAIVHLLYDCIVRKLLRNVKLDVKLVAKIIHYLFKLLNLNYDVKEADMGRELYLSIRKV